MKEKVETGEWTEEDAFVAAFNDAQDLTVNFTKSGYMAKRINEATAFFNVSIRGPEKVYRGLKEKPIQTIVKGLAYLTLLGIGLWYKNKDKQWYKNLPLSYKYGNYFFEIGDSVYRLPIPFELGILFKSIPEASLDYWQTKNPKVLEGLIDVMKSQLPPVVPTMFEPSVQVMRNRNFLDIPIESAGMQYQLVTERKRIGTSTISIALSKGLYKLGGRISPIMIDHLINQHTGGFLRQFPSKAPILDNADKPLIGRFYLRMPENPRRQLNDFYNTHELLTQKKKAGLITKDELRRLNRLNNTYSDNIQVRTMLSRQFKFLRNYREKGDEEGMKKIYERMQTLLERYGFK